MQPRSYNVDLEVNQQMSLVCHNLPFPRLQQGTGRKFPFISKGLRVLADTIAIALKITTNPKTYIF